MSFNTENYVFPCDDFISFVTCQFSGRTRCIWRIDYCSIHFRNFRMLILRWSHTVVRSLPTILALHSAYVCTTLNRVLPRQVKVPTADDTLQRLCRSRACSTCSTRRLRKKRESHSLLLTARIYIPVCVSCLSVALLVKVYSCMIVPSLHMRYVSSPTRPSSPAKSSPYVRYLKLGKRIGTET
jgi:hypothetical protein